MHSIYAVFVNMHPLPLVCGNETVELYKVTFFKSGLNKISTKNSLINTNEESAFVKYRNFLKFNGRNTDENT